MRTTPKSSLLLLALLSSGAFAACSKDEISCGDGTELTGDTCIASAMGGMGGQGGTPVETTGGSAPVIVDFDDKSRAQVQVEEDFEGAIAAAPVSDSSVLVVWKPLSVEGLTYNVYIAQDEDDLSFGRPQESAEEGADSLEIAGLKEGEKYFIAVVPVLLGVELEVGRTPVSVTPKTDDESPSFTGVGSAEPAGGAEVLLEWDAATDDGTPEEAMRYYVYMSEDVDYFEQLDELPVQELGPPFVVSPPGATSLVVTGLPLAETEYTFHVRAVDAAKNFDDNTITLREVSGEDTSLPSFAGCTTATMASASAISVTWNPAVDDVATSDEMTYNFYVAKEPGTHNFSEPHFSVVGGRSAEIPDLENSQIYYVVCRAADPSGNEEENKRQNSAVTADDGTPPTQPTITATSGLQADSVDLVWTPSTDNQSADDKIDYRIFLSTSEGVDPELDEDMDDVPDQLVRVTVPGDLTGQTAARIQELDSNTTYYMKIVAYDEALNFTASEEKSFTTLVSLREDIEIPIFQNSCALPNCHSTSTAPLGLRLEPGWSFQSLVDKPAESSWAKDQSLLIVEPESPETSHLIQRLRDLGAEEGDYPAMPASDDLLSESQISTIERWISEGALDN